MPDTREAPSLLEAAEQAAAAGDYAAAEGLLREAATRQEETLGPRHPDLVNTLNNLGVVCEMTDNPIDAEHYFRRAHSIATATLPPDHPFVETSRKNLHDFCAARGRPVELPPSSPQVAAWLEEPAPSTVQPPESPTPALSAVEMYESEAPATVTAQPQEWAPAKKSRNWLAWGALGGVALLVVILTMVRPGGTPVDETKSQATTAVSPAPEKTAASPTPPPPSEPIAQPQPTATPAPAPGPAPAPAPTKGDEASATPTTRSTPAATATVVTAKLCTALQTWRCEEAASQAPPGPMFFYTQVKSPTATTIEHRWYQGDRLIQAVQLRIQANPGAGYRTYSRHSVSREPAGEWRVELRSADGTLLDEERITVK